MKIYLSKPRYHWISPYTILEKVFFWREIDYDEPIIKKLSSFLYPICTGLGKLLNFIHPPINYVKIDYWDTWSVDYTLSPIISILLKQLKQTTHGAPLVDDDDVPVELKSTSAPAKENEWDIDDNHFKRWDYVLDEMIWSFEQLSDEDNDAQFYSGVADIKPVPAEWDSNGKPALYSIEKGPNDTFQFDHESFNNHNKRINNGLRLFGKYFRNLWD